MVTTFCNVRLQQKETVLQIAHGVILLACYQFKIGQAIVRSISIHMMNMFIALKWAAKMLRHDMSVFINFASFIRHRVMEAKKEFDVSVFGSFPVQGSIPMFLFPAEVTETLDADSGKLPSFHALLHHIDTPQPFLAALPAMNRNKPAQVGIIGHSSRLFATPQNSRANRQLFIVHGYIIPHGDEQGKGL